MTGTGAVVADPGIERGPYKVYRRTDGAVCVMDRRMFGTPAWSRASVAVRDTLDQAIEAAEALDRGETVR